MVNGRALTLTEKVRGRVVTCNDMASASGSGLTQDEMKKIQEKKQQALDKLSRKRRTEAAFFAPQSKRSKSYHCESPPAPKCSTSCSTRGSRITAILTLVSSNSFNIEAPYDKELIEILKKIPSRQYGMIL